MQPKCKDQTDSSGEYSLQYNKHLPGGSSLKFFIHWIIAEEYFSLQPHAE